MIEFSSSLKLNKIHKVDSPFNENLKNIFFSREALISGEGRSEKLGKWATTGISIVMKIGDGQFRKRTSALNPWCQTPCDASIFLHARSNFRKKMKKLNFQATI